MILSRVKFYPQERVDLEDLNTLLSAARTDAKFWTKQFLSGENYILKGLTVSGVGLTSGTIEMDNATLILGQGTQDFSYFISDAIPTDLTISDSDLVDGVRNYVELQLTYEDGTPITKAFWDPSANGGLGAEFNQQVNTVTDLQAEVVVVQGGFTGNPDRVPVAIIDTNGSGIIKVILDRRSQFFRLGTPADPENEFTWATQSEPPYAINLTGVVGTYVAGETVTFSGGATAVVTVGGTTNISVELPTNLNFASGNTLTGTTSGATGTVNTIVESFTGADKDIDDIKEVVSALQTEIKRLKGTRFWYQIQGPSLIGTSSFLNSATVSLTSDAKYTWSGTQLSITDSNGVPAATDNLAKIRLFGKAQTLNLRRQDGQASTSLITLSDGEILFVKLPASGNRNYSGIGVADTNYQIVTADSFVLNDENYWIAFREGSRLYIRGNGELMAGESAEISDNINQNILTSIGLTSEVAAPNYTSTRFVVQSSSLIAAISKLDDSIRWMPPVADFATLPALGNLDGDVRLVLDTRLAYTWHTTGTVWKPVNSTGGGQKIIGGGILSVEAVDAGFNAGTGFGASSGPQTLSLQSDGKIIGAGSFLSFNGLTRTRMVRLSSSGSDDAAFAANLGTGFDGVVLSTLTLGDDSILVGGGFNNFNGNARAKMVKLNSDGTEDTAFYTNLGTGFSDYITHIKTQSDGKIIVIGNFTTFNGNSRNRIVRLNADGTEDGTFGTTIGTGFNAEADALSIDSSDKIVIGGVFTSFNGTTRNRILRLNADGTVDTAFYTNLGTGISGGGVFSSEIQPSDGKILLGGAFTSLNGNTRNRILRLNSDGTEDTAFYTNLGTALDAQTNLQGIKVQTDGKIVVVGAFTAFNGNTRNRMIRLNSDGTEDTAFYTNLGTAFSGSLGPVMLTSDGGIIATGPYATFNGATRNGIVKLTSTGVEESQVVASFVELDFTADMFLEIKGLDYSDNTIDSTESPLQFSNDLEAAYVIPNFTVGGPALTVTIDALDQVPANATILARRVGNDIIVGSSSTRLSNGQSTEIYAQESIQTRNTIRSTDFLRSDNPVTWTGTELQFTTDIILESINVKDGTTKLSTILTANSPIALTNNQIAYVVINRNTGSGNVTPVVASTVPTVTSQDDEYVIIGKRVDALGVGYFHMPLHKQVLEPGQTVRLGASGSGSGNANELLESIKNRLIDSPFALVTPNIFEIDEDDKVDIASTGAFSLVSKDFELDTIGQTLVSIQMLDPDEFLDSSENLEETELLVFWNALKTDPAATYEVSRNGGNEWQTVAMDRVGVTETFRGVHVFDEEAVDQTLKEYDVANADAVSALTATGSGTELAQSFVITEKSLMRSITLYMNKIESAGTLLGKFFVSLIADNAGVPSTDLEDIIAESVGVEIDPLATGNLTLAVAMPFTVLAPGTYHIRVRTDAAYKASFSAGVRSLDWRTDTSSPTATGQFSTFNSPTWTAVPTTDATYKIEGIVFDLRVRITSSVVDVALKGYGIYYEKNVGSLVTGVKNIEVFKFSGDDDETDFLVSNFLINPELLRVYDVNSGQVYRYGAFSIDGATVKFEAGQFDMPGENITLIFEQSSSGGFDNSDANAILLATNHLGSTDPNYDKSLPGRGIVLQRPDGIKREISIDNLDNIVVSST